MMKKSLLKKLIIAAFWIIVWQVVAMIVASPLLLPSPAATAGSLIKLLGDGGFYLDALATIARCAIAIVMSLIAGTLLSLASYKWQVIRDVLSLPVAIFKAVPIMAIAIYMLFLLSAGNVPTLVCFIMCFPIVYTNLLTGLDSMDNSYLEMAKVYGLDDARIVKYIYIPSMFPYFKSALSIISGMSWKAVVTAEVLSVPQFSLGYELMNAKYYLETETLFAYVIAIVVIAIIFEKIIKAVLERMSPSDYSYSKIRRREKKNYCSCDNCKLESGELVIDNLSKSFGDKQVLSHLNLKAESAKVTALMAPSGSGKTTLLRIICGIEQADEGRVVAPERIAVLFQEDRLLPWLNVYDNLALICNEDERIINVLKAVGLGEEKFKLPKHLSGGMNHRVAMARTFLYGASLLIFDEPFRGLDEDTREAVVKNLWEPYTRGKTVLLITHDQDIAEELAETIERGTL